MLADASASAFGPSCHDHGIRGHGSTDSDVMIIGISPGKEEMRTGVPMSGMSGNLTDSFLRACGWSREQTYVTNMVCFECRIPTLSEYLECKPRLEREVALVKPKLVVLLGQHVTSQFFGDRKFSEVRGALDWYPAWNCYLMPTYHPAALLYGDASKFISQDLARDFQKIREFFDYPPRPNIEFYTVEGREQAQIILNNLPRSGHFISLDIETPFKDEDETAAIEDPISCFSIAAVPHEYTTDGSGERTWWFPGELAAQLEWPTDVEWTFHNGPYDTISIAKNAGVLLPIKHDTMYMSYALDERKGYHGLKPNLRETEAIGFYEKAWGKDAQAVKRSIVDPATSRRKQQVVVSEWDARRKADPEGFKQYNATDSLGTGRLAQRYLRRLRADNMESVYNDLLLPGVNTYRLMQQHGMKVSRERVAALLHAWGPLAEQKLANIQQQVRDLGGPEAINPGSWQQMSKFMYGTLRLPGGPSVAEPVIEALAGEHKFIDDLLDYRHLLKALGTYVVGLWPSVKPSTGRIHPWAKLHGVVTGRVAYQNPAINTTPRPHNPNPYLSKLKYMFVATDDDHILLELDYKQAEVWMAAVYCDDPNMWADLASGDFHRRTAAYVNKCSMEEVTDWQRTKAKNSTFGKFFLIGAQKFAKQNDITIQEASRYMREWDARYPKYMEYVERTFREAVETGELVTLTGRKRRYPYVADSSIMPETCNYKIQATSHDCLMSSIIEAFPLVRDMDGCIILDIHDAMLIECRRDNVMEVANRVAELMRRPRFPGLPSLPVEAKVGPSWAEMHEIKLAT
jgi:uracil-DNA glycosylase family 4